MSFISDARAAGFTPEQAAFLDTKLARAPHVHTSEDITDFEEAVCDALPEADEDEDED